MRILRIVAVVLLSPMLCMSTAFAVCVESPANTFTCNTSAPNPDLTGIQQNSNNNSLVVDMLPGSAIAVSGPSTQAIRLGSGSNQVTLTGAEASNTNGDGIAAGSGANIQIDVTDSKVSCEENCLTSNGTATSVINVTRSLVASLDNNGIQISGTGAAAIVVQDSVVLAGTQPANNFGIYAGQANDQATILNSHVAGYETDGPGNALVMSAGNDSVVLGDGAELTGIIDCGDRGNDSGGPDDSITFEMEVPNSELAGLQAELAGKGDDDSITINGRLYQWRDCENLIDDLSGGNTADTRATFKVTKVFADGNPNAEVDVTLSCTSGLPISQNKTLKNGESVTFVLTSFGYATADCEITEDGASGYTGEYDDGFTSSDESCVYNNVDPGDANECTITNTPAPVEVVFNKDWIIEGENQNGVDPSYRIDLHCNGGEVVGISPNGPDDGFGYEGDSWHAWWQSHSDADTTYTAHVIPWVYASTTCTVTETVYDDSVETSSDCGALYPGPSRGQSMVDEQGYFLIAVNEGFECTFTNTAFFEGIPTLSQYGMAILALLMLGVGFVGFRRLV